MKKARHGGKIILYEKSVLEWLGYPEGKLHFFGRSEDFIGTVAVIEDKSMPEVKEGEMLEIIQPSVMYWNVTDSLLLRLYKDKKWWMHIRDTFWVVREYWRLVRTVNK